MKFDHDSSYKGPDIIVTGLIHELRAEFPQLDIDGLGYEQVEKAIELVRATIGAANLVGESTQVKRIPNGPDGERENIAEHSFTLSVLARRIAKILDLDLDVEKVENFARFHDLLELEVGDKNTFNLTPQELEEKERAEHAAKEKLLDALPGWIADILDEYERQDTAEARFVRALDKLLPLAVNIAHKDITVVRRDFDITSLEGLLHAHRSINQDLANRFDEEWLKVIIVAHAIECMMFEDIYREESSKSPENRKDPYETKRRFLVNQENLQHELDTNPSIVSEDIRQFYPTGGEDGASTRVRSYNDEKFTILNRSAGTIQRRKGDEITLDGMTVEAFDAWHKGTNTKMIEKTKYYIPLGDIHTIEVGKYHSTLEGLIIAAIKFNGRDALEKSDQLDVPWWFDREITNDPNFFGHRLGKKEPSE